MEEQKTMRTLPANEALARRLDAVAGDYLLARYSGPGNPMGTRVLRTGCLLATRVPFAPMSPLMNTARGLEQADDVDRVLRFYFGELAADQDAGCWVETTPYTPGAVTDALLARGFRLERQAATLYAPMAAAAHSIGHSGAAGGTGGLQISDVAATDLPAFLDTLNVGFGVAEAALSGIRSNQSFWRDVAAWHLFLATIDGKPIGAAVLSVHEDAELGRVGYLAAASTLVPMRGRGAQSALIAARISRARALGCRILCGQAAWGTTSQANMQRAGLQICHLRTVWARTSRV